MDEGTPVLGTELLPDSPYPTDIILDILVEEVQGLTIVEVEPSL